MPTKTMIDAENKDRFDRIDAHIKDIRNVLSEMQKGMNLLLNVVNGTNVEGSGLISKVNRHENKLDAIETKLNVLETYTKQLTWFIGVVVSAGTVLLLSYLFRN